MKRSDWLGALLVAACVLPLTAGASESATALDPTTVPTTAPVLAAWTYSAKSGPWSSPDTWSDGKVPADGARIFVRSGDQVTYDLSSEAKVWFVHVAGELDFATDRDTTLNVGLLLVQAAARPADDATVAAALDTSATAHAHHHDHAAMNLPPAALTIGTSDQPVAADHVAKIRLTYQPGMDADAWPALVVSGRVELNGRPMDRTWLKLDQYVAPGDRKLTLAAPAPGWRVGDRVLIPTTAKLSLFENGKLIPSVRELSETEERTIAAIDGTTLTLDAPAKFMHRVEKPWAGDVANLSRNVIIESADPAGPSGNSPRGHTMIHAGSSGAIRYAEFRELGKKNLLGRYALHFHAAGDSLRGFSVIGASIWNSDNRWMTVHGTNYLVVRDCVGYNAVGHGFFLEDGTEQFNVFDRNLAVQALHGEILPQQTLPFDHNDGAGFWWANSLNTFTRNNAVECDQYGYRYEARPVEGFEPVLTVHDNTGELKNTDIRTLPFVRFDDNEARSQRRFAMNLGGVRSPAGPDDYVNGEVEGSKIIIERAWGGDVGGVGPDRAHPFVVRNFRAWTSQWVWHSGTPAVFVNGLAGYDSNYGIWRTRMDLVEFKNTSFVAMANSDNFYSWGGNPNFLTDFNRSLRIVDTLPPTTVITRVTRTSSGVTVEGTTADNGVIKAVTVNDVEVSPTQHNYQQWRVTLPGDVSELKAVSTDNTGNVEKTPHVVSVRQERRVTRVE